MRELSKKRDSLKSFTYTNEKIRQEIFQAMNSTEFQGISVRIEDFIFLRRKTLLQNKCKLRSFKITTNIGSRLVTQPKNELHLLHNAHGGGGGREEEEELKGDLIFQFVQIIKLY